MSFPSTSSAFSNWSTASSSSPHKVAFGQVPGSQPGVLSWGFGMSSANRGGNGWSSTPSPARGGGGGGPAGGARMTPPPPPSQVAWGATSTSTRRRRRSDTPESETETEQPRVTRPTLTMKRQRKTSTTTAATSEGLAHGLAGSLSLGSTTPTSSIEDLGKSLASLDKPSLLGILSSLLESHPHLASTVSSLLPPPTLASSLELVTSLTRSIHSQIPLNSSPSYTLSRMRLPLESFVQETRKLLSIYVPSTLPPPTTRSTGTTEELYHPTTTMSFLLELTSSYLSISQLLPPSAAGGGGSSNPLQAHLLPTLINSYHVFITRLSNAVNDQGKILAQSTVKLWFDQVSSLVPFEGQGQGRGPGQLENEAVVVGKKALEGVRDRLKREIGWLIGWKPDSSSSSSLIQDQRHSVTGGGGGMNMGIGMEGLEQEEEEL